jgi:Helix-turn-helix domain
MTTSALAPEDTQEDPADELFSRYPEGVYYIRIPADLKGQVSAAAFEVFFCLASYAKRRFIAWPTYKEIEGHTGLSRSKVRTAIAELVRDKWLRVVPWALDDGDQVSNTYVIFPETEAYTNEELERVRRYGYAAPPRRRTCRSDG